MEVQALQRQKAEARWNNLFQLVELTMTLSELVTFPCLFCLELLLKHIPLPPQKIHTHTLVLACYSDFLENTGPNVPLSISILPKMKITILISNVIWDSTC